MFLKNSKLVLSLLLLSMLLVGCGGRGELTFNALLLIPLLTLVFVSVRLRIQGRNKTALLLPFLLLTIVSCGGGGGARVSDTQLVQNQLIGWSEDLNERDLVSLMSRYSGEYLHNGTSYEDEQLGWAFLFALHERMYIKIEELHFPSLVVDGDTAEVVMHFNLVINVFENGVWTRDLFKEELIVLLHKESGTWLLYGNQEGGGRNINNALWNR